MKTFICLLVILSLSQTALIGSTIYSLSRLFQYKITIENSNNILVEYATLAPTNQDCPLGKCFIGWINNYTLGSTVYQGYRIDLGSSNPIFSARVLQPLTLALAINNSLPIFNKTLLELTSKIITPIFFAESQNNSKISHFVRLDNRTASQMLSFSLDYSLYNFEQLANNWLSTSSWVGWNRGNPSSDVILFDSGLSCIIRRQMVFQAQKTKIRVELVSKSLFTDLSMQRQVIQEIENTVNNVVNMPINEKIIYPVDNVASLIQLL